MNNSRGVSLVEIMIAMAITAIISVFSFDTIRTIVMTSMTVQRKSNFESLATDVRILLSKLDQCTCNFYGLSMAGGTLHLPSGKLLRYASTTGPQLFPPAGPVACTPSGNDQIVAQEGQIKYNVTVSPAPNGLQLINIQPFKVLNVTRAILEITASVPDQSGKVAFNLSREYPVLFTMNPNNPSLVAGCIAVSR
jgi:prepilin-type N-terminal cleavage/methylation domain-containing protein